MPAPLWFNIPVSLPPLLTPPGPNRSFNAEGYSRWVVEGGLAHDIYDKFSGFFVERFSGAGDIQVACP